MKRYLILTILCFLLWGCTYGAGAPYNNNLHNPSNNYHKPKVYDSSYSYGDNRTYPVPEHYEPDAKLAPESVNKPICRAKPAIGPKKIGKPYVVAGIKYYPLSSADGYSEEGIASWYGSDFHGKKTANGERYNKNAMTAAHKTLPIPTMVRVQNLENGKEIIVRVNDRGPFVKGRLIDLTETGARKLGMIEKGTARVRVSVISEDPDCYTVPAANDENINTGSFAVQIGAFSNEESVSQIVSRFGKRALVSKSYINGKAISRIRITGYNNRISAENAAETLSREFPGAFVVEK